MCSSEVGVHLILAPVVLSAHLCVHPGVDDAYYGMHDSLMQEDLAGKLVLLQPPIDQTPLVRQMAVRRACLDGLFQEERLSPIPTRRPGPLGISESNLHPHVITNGGLISPQSETQTSISPPPADRSSDGLRQIDPSKVCGSYFYSRQGC